MNLDLLATDIVTRLEHSAEDRINRVELVKGLILQEIHRDCPLVKVTKKEFYEAAQYWGKPTHYFDE